VEWQNACNVLLRGEWQTSRYINLDNITANSYIYSDKTSGALWKIEDESVTALQNVKDETGLAIYPNPVLKGKLNIDNVLTDSLLRIYDLAGNILLTSDLKAGKTNTVDVSAFIEGVYLVNIETGNRIFTQKIVLNKN
jgi:beta-galactosidase